MYNVYTDTLHSDSIPIIHVPGTFPSTRDINGVFLISVITTQSDSGFPELFSAVLHCRGHGRQSLALSSRRELGTGGGRGLCSIDRCLTGEAGALTWGG